MTEDNNEPEEENLGQEVDELLEDELDDDEKIKIIIHELMHIPKCFGGGFKHHDFVHEKNVEMFYNRYVNLKQRKEWW